MPTLIQTRIKSVIPDSKVLKEKEFLYASYQKMLTDADTPVDAKNIIEHRMKNLSSSFDEILKNNANAFINWRYFFGATDSSSINYDVWFFNELCTALHNEMVSIMNTPI